MSEQEKDLQADIDYFIQEQATNALLNQTSFIENLSVQSNLFEQLKSQFFNEMLDDATSNGVASKKIEQWLSIRTLDELKQLNAEAKQHFLYHGITFNVYGDKEGVERTIPFDLIPRVIEKKQWEKIAAGCAQRVKALNYFLDDIYHGQHILKEQLIPESQIICHEAFQPHMLKHTLKGKIYSQISGIDIIRDSEGEFFVLEDNLRTPSGVSYMIECRNISQQLMPELCAANNLQGIEHYPSLLKEILQENSEIDEKEHLDYVLAHLDQLVIKEAQGSGGYGMLIGPKASSCEIDEFRQKLLATPHEYIAQPTLALSVAPTLTTAGVAERHIDLRPFVLSSPYRTEIVPGGLTRVAMQAGSLVVNSSQGGGIKDTWVVETLHS